jgi:pimeloyl-ACP methyl ester carboxylesterase
MEEKLKELDWITEIRLDAEVPPPDKPQRVMMFSGFGSSPEVLRDLGTAIHQRLPASVLMHGLAGHTGDEQSFYRSRAWDYWREAENLFLRYWTEEGRPLALVGYSTGANVVLTIAARHPSKVAGIILLSPYLRSRSATTRALSYGIAGLYYLALPLCAIGGLAYIFSKRKRKSWSKSRALAVAGGSLAGVAATAKLMSSATVSLGEAPTLMRNGEEFRAPHYERVSVVGGSTLVPFQLLTRWIARKTVVPVTYVFGGQDSVVDVEHGVMVAPQNPLADLFVLSNAQHRVVTEPRVSDIVCAAILRCFHEDSARQQDFADVDITADDPAEPLPESAGI